MGVLLKNISDMRERGELCDVVVIVEKESFHVHRLVLAASSAFFHAMFTSGFREKDKNEVQLIGQTAANFKNFLCHVYSGQVHLTEENIGDVYSIATYLQAEELTAYCEEYMSKNVNVNTCFKYLALTEEFSKSSVYGKAVKEIAQNFHKFSQDQSIFELKPQIFKEVLRHEKLASVDEDQILGTALSWLEVNNADEGTVCEILQEVRWGLLDLGLLQSYLHDDDPRLSSESCQNMIKEAIHYLENERMQPLLGGQFSTPRGLPVLAAFGGDTGEFIHEAVGLGSDDIIDPFFWHGQNIIEPLPMPLHYRECNAAVVINNILFLIGGYQYGYDDEDQDEDTIASSQVLKYNPLLNCWRMMASLSSGRAGHSAVAIEYPDGVTRIMVVGGSRKRIGDIPSTEVYDIASDSWSERDSFPFRVFAPAACVYKGCVYVSGGRDESQCMNFMYRFTPATGMWERLSNMLFRRSSHSMCVVNNLFYIVGVQLTLDTDNYAEMYNPQLDQFTKVDWIYPFFAEGNCVVHKDRIYRVRGECSALTLDTKREEVIKNLFFSYSEFSDRSSESLLDYSTMNSSLAIFHMRNQIENLDEFDYPSSDHEVDFPDAVDIPEDPIVMNDPYDMFFL